MIYIYAVRTSGGEEHEHITAVRWRSPDNGRAGEATREEVVDWVSRRGWAVYARGDDAHIARVWAVDASPLHLRTYDNGIWTDNLLALPRY